MIYETRVEHTAKKKTASADKKQNYGSKSNHKTQNNANRDEYDLMILTYGIYNVLLRMSARAHIFFRCSVFFFFYFLFSISFFDF